MREAPGRGPGEGQRALGAKVGPRQAAEDPLREGGGAGARAQEGRDFGERGKEVSFLWEISSFQNNFFKLFLPR